jgi:cytochrome P450
MSETVPRLERALNGCPVLEGFSPLLPDQLADPYPLLAKARREVTVFYMPEFDQWCVTRYRDVEEILRDPETYSSAHFVNLPPFPAEVAAQLPDGHPLEATLVSTDPPRHTRIRKLAQKAFIPRQANAKADAVRELANTLIDGFIETGRVDLATAYCKQIPIRVVGPILGVSMEEAAQLYDWSTQALILVGNGWKLSPDELLDYGRGQVEFDRYVRALVEDRRANPGGEDDLVTRLIFAESDDGSPALEDSEIVGIVAAALAAGSDSSATTMAQCVYSLLEVRSRWEEVIADPELIENAVEETMRVRGAVRSVPRTTTRDCVLGGVQIPAGATVCVHIGSASHDEEIFADGERFDLHRPNAKEHLGMGKWLHFCIGAPLARMQLRVAVATLAERIPSLRLVPGHSFSYVPSIQVPPVIDGLVVDWDL